MLDKLDKTILVIDDDPIFMDQCKFMMPDHFKTVLFASNGDEGLKILRSNKVDLIVLDLDMPVMTGDEVMKIIKNDPKLKDIFVLVLSSLLREKNMEDECNELDSTIPESERGKKVENDGISKGNFDMSQKKRKTESWSFPGTFTENDEFLANRMAMGLVDKIHEIFGKEPVYGERVNHDETMRKCYQLKEKMEKDSL